MDLSQAYSAGFATYLQNFLAADPDYDWVVVHFAPSTPSFKINFKANYAVEIAKARADLEVKIASELEVLKKKEGDEGVKTHWGKDDETIISSPTNTTAT